MDKNDIVRKTDGTKAGGRIKYAYCWDATTAGGKLCDKKTCPCAIKDHFSVEWPAAYGGGTFTCHISEIELDPTAQTQPSLTSSGEDLVGIAIDQFIDNEAKSLDSKDKCEPPVATPERSQAMYTNGKPVDFDAYYGIVKDGKVGKQPIRY